MADTTAADRKPEMTEAVEEQLAAQLIARLARKG
jgi:hypothetical protein